MKKQILSILILAIAAVFFNSCEKEENTSNAIVAIDPDAPKASYENPELDGPVKELEIPVGKASDKTFEEEFIVLNKDTNAIQSRDYTIDLYSYYGGNVACASYVEGTLYAGSNKILSRDYAIMGITANLDGADQIYAFNVTQRSNVSISMTNTTQNLAVSLFRGARQCISNNTTGSRCTLKLIHWVAGSSSTSLYDDYVGPVTLEPGEYVVIVDSRAGYPSNYNLRVNCSPALAGCVTGTTNLLADNFESYRLGALDPQALHWTKYNPWAYYDAEVGNNGGGNYATIQYQSNTTAANQPSPMIEVGPRTNGDYLFATKMWIFSNRSAYFDVQTRLAYDYVNNQVGVRVYFFANGTGVVYPIANNNNTHLIFTYPQNQWMTIHLRLGLDSNLYALTINGQLKAQWYGNGAIAHGTGARRIQAIRFYPFATNSQFFLDDICFGRYN